MSAVSPLIRARGLVKRFGSFTAVDGIDFDLLRGEAFGFLGPNGAGKSSTMRMIGCVSPPSAGELSILGLDPVKDGREIRARLGVVPHGSFGARGFARAIEVAARGVRLDVVGRTHERLATAGALRVSEPVATVPDQS